MSRDCAAVNASDAASLDLTKSGAAIKQVPRSRSLRDQIRLQAETTARRFDAARPIEKADLEASARGVLAELNQPDAFLGWTMVMLASAVWREQVMGTEFSRRLLLLPGLLAGSSEFATRAKQLGYGVLAVEETQAVLEALVGGEVDAIVGLASLDVLEKAIDHILWFGLPCVGLPLLDEHRAAAEKGILANSATGAFDADWLREMIELPHVAAELSPPNYIHLLRVANGIFEPDELERLTPRRYGRVDFAALDGDAASLADPVAGTEAIAYDFLSRGGKHSRPFIVVAVYDAMTGGFGARAGAHRHLAGLPDAIKRAALSIETFHKASLVHDDIEDDDPFRYGEPTIHRRFGVPVAINVGDYLIGLGYSLVSREARALGTDVVGDILDRLSEAHLRLAEGQGAELLWRDARDKRLSPQDALRIYELKTAPAFEAALLTGLRLAGPIDSYRESIGRFARSLGTAFQIVNDLNDWRSDRHNKLVATGDVIGGRPTLLWALALEGLKGKAGKELESLAAESPTTQEAVRKIGRLYREAGVFDKSGAFIEQCEVSAREVAEGLAPPELGRLLLHLVDMVLKRPA
jgi:geranylgeranyl pyrophosphate synthase